MAFLQSQPRLTQCYVYVANELNKMGICPNGAQIKPWIAEELDRYGIVADTNEITMVLTGMLAENAIKQEDIERFMKLYGKEGPGDGPIT